jgi:DNA-binding NtrC family response regulator
MTPIKILLVDDEPELRRSIASILPTALPARAVLLTEASNGQEAVRLTSEQDFDLVLMDVKMPEMDGLEALAQIKANDPRTFVVILTAHSNLQDAVVAIKEGAYDYIEKPIQVNTLQSILQKCLEAQELVSDLALSNPIFDDDVDSDFVGHSQKMRDVFSLIHKLTKVETTVLVRGENGTGKELVARAIHFNSPRKDGAFVAINCGAIPEALMESELFGHEKGSFTGAVERKIGKFQLANNGTLFLDEIGELRLDLQVKLLRVLQERKFVPVGGTREVKTNARIIAATNRNLEKMIEDMSFREDLFYRLNVMPIFLPPLRDRREDIPLLVQSFIKKFIKSMNSDLQGITPEALQKLTQYQWPGNIRELENAIERAFILESSPQIQVQSLPQVVLDSTKNNFSASGQAALDYEAFKENSEREFILSALKANKGRINQTVAKANIPKNTLLRKMKKYGITAKDGQSDSEGN